MPRDGTTTREAILDTAQGLILDRGYTGVSIDSIIDKVGITKGAFFYHFKSKQELALALVERFAAADAAFMDSNLQRAEKLSDDPLQQMLILIGLFIEVFEDLTEPYPGCLFASYVYELHQFDDETRKLIADALLRWRDALVVKIDAIKAKYPPRKDVNSVALADMVTVIFEGAFVMAKALYEPQVIAQQLRELKNYFEVVFS